MSNNSSITLFHPNIGTKILLTGFLHAFSVSRFNPSPGLTKSLLTERHFRACKNDPIYHPRPIPRATKISWMFFGSAVFGDSGAVFYSF